MLALSTKYLFNVGVPILTRLIYSMIIVSFIILGEIKIKKIKVLNTNKAQIITLFFIGIFGTGFCYFMQVAINLSPNVGYVNAANAASISLLTLVSAFLFKDDLSAKKLLGIAGVTAGLFILFL